MNKLFIYISFLIALTAGANKIYAQVYPVTVTTNVTPPYSLKLDDYADAAYERIQGTVYMADPLAVNYKYKIRLVVKGPGNVLLTTIPGAEAGPYFINGNETQIYKGSELASLFDPVNISFNGITLQQYNLNAGLPEGFYQFHFEILDFNQTIPVSNINAGYANAWLMLNDPPIINQPQNEATIRPLEPQNIFFQWTPRHTGSPNSAFSTVYDIQIVEIFPATRSANDAMLSSPPIFEFTTASTAYNYGIADPQLVEGKWYAFRIRAYAQNGYDLFKNQGYSEVYRFYYGTPCPSVSNIKITPIDLNNSLLTFDAAPAHQSIEVEYKKERQNWSAANVMIVSVSDKVPLYDLESGEKYIVRIKGVCMNNASEYDTISFRNIGDRASCNPPKSFTAVRKDPTDNTSPVYVAWIPVPDVTGYIITARTATASATFTSKVEQVTMDHLIDLISKQKIPVPNKFELSISVQCKDGSTTEGPFIEVDLSKGTFTGADCTVPYEEQVTANQIDLSTVKISWMGAASFTQYRFRYRVKGSNDIFQEVLTSDKFILVTGLNRDVIYEYQIQYKCVNNKWVSGNSNVFTINYDPATTVDPGTGSCYYPSSIRAQVLSTTSAEINWGKETGVKSYQIFYRPKIVAGIDEEWLSVITDKQKIKLTDLLLNTEYEFYIRSLCTDGLFSLHSDLNIFNTSNVNSFTGTCLPPVLHAAVPQSDVEAVVSWDTRREYTKYQIQYRKHGQGDWMIIENATEHTKYLSALTASTLYDYQVTAYCGLTISAPTAIDTFTTLPPGRKKDEFKCGDPTPDNSPNGNTPIAQLSVGDVFDAADFDLKVSVLTSERPYNGSAIVEIPYLEHSKVEFIMQDVWVNDKHQMYQGKVIFKGVLITVVDPALANQISGFIDDMDDFLGDLSHNMAVADSIQDALNESIGQLTQPIDWDQYDGWTAQQFLDTAKVMAEKAQALMTSGSPANVIEGKQLMIKTIELIRMAAGLGNATFQALSDEAKKFKLRLKVILDTMQARYGRQLHSDSLALKALVPPLNEKYDTYEPSSLDTYEIAPTDYIIGDMNTTPGTLSSEDSTALASNTKTTEVYTKAVTYRQKEYIVNTYAILLEYIKMYSRDANITRLAKKMERDLQNVIQGRDLDQLSPAELTELQNVVEEYLNKFFIEQSEANPDQR